MTDEALCAAFVGGDSQAYNALLERHGGLVRLYAKQFAASCRLGVDDLEQEIRFALARACQAFVSGSNSWRTFAFSCAKNRLIQLATTAGRYVGGVTGCDTVLEEGEEDDVSLVDLPRVLSLVDGVERHVLYDEALGYPRSRTAEDLQISRERVRQISDLAKAKLRRAVRRGR